MFTYLARVLYKYQCQADLSSFSHSFGLPHTYLNRFTSEITGCLMEYSLDCFKSLDQNGCTPINQNMCHYKL